MSEPETPARPFYVTGGTLKPGEPSYVERRADTELFESLLVGEFCYVLTARQMGKSSLMARTAKRLEQAGVASAIVDLTQIGSERGDQAAPQWYFGIANLIHRQLGIAAPLRPWWQERADLSSVQRLTDFFRELVLANLPGRVVIFVDEIDSTIGLPFADDFFAALRACFNARATDATFERLTFVLLGVATPDQLMRDPARTPFNIGKRIELTDFTLDEAQVLAPGLHSDPGEAGRRLERVLHWSGGHPYLTQALCRAVRERGDTGTAEEAVDPQVEEFFLTSRAQREETNLKHARARLERRGPEGRRLLQLYRRVRRGKVVADQPTSPLFAQLKLAGVVKTTDAGRLAVRNRIYGAVFSPEWAKAAMPADRGRQLAAATMAATLAGVLVWYAAFQPRPYEEAFRAAIQDNGYNGALEAYTTLHANPFSRSRATELLQEFWKQRALRYALAGQRDESLLCYLKGLELKDDERLRKQARNLVGSDYEKLRLTLRHADQVRSVAFSPDGRILATGSDDYSVRLWDTRSGKPLMLPLRHEGRVVAVAFSFDGRTIATGNQKSLHYGSSLRIWDVRSGRPIVLPLQLNGFLSALAFSPDGRTLASGSQDLREGGAGIARLWDARSGKALGVPMVHEAYVDSLAFSPDGQTFATGTVDIPGLGVRESIRLWDAHTGRPLTPPLQQPGGAYALTFSPNGKILAFGSSAGISLWNARTEKPVQFSAIRSTVIFWPDSQTFVVWAPNSAAIIVLNAHTGKPLARPLQLEESAGTVAFSPDGRNLATGFRNAARLWDLSTMKTSSRISFHESSHGFVALSPDGRTFATKSKNNTVRLWDVHTRKPFAPVLQHSDPVDSAVFSPDGRVLATGARDNAIRLWDVYTGEPLVPPLQHQASVFVLAFSPDGRILATGSKDTVSLWDVRTGRLLAGLQQGYVTSAAFSPDSRTLATGSFDNTARLWDVLTGKSLTPRFPHEGAVSALTFSPDGRIFATGDFDGMVRLWDARTGTPLTPSWKIQGPVQTLEFKLHGKALVAATNCWLTTYLWDGKKAVPQGSQLLHGVLRGAFRSSSDCELCLQVALWDDTDHSFHLETVRLDGTSDPPIEGDPKALLEKWQARLGLKFDEQMRPVTAVDP